MIENELKAAKEQAANAPKTFPYRSVGMSVSNDSVVPVQDDGITRWICDEDSDGNIAIHDDPYFLVNNISPNPDPNIVDNWQKNLVQAVHSPDLGLSDDQLLSIVKSRYLQSPSELRSYIETNNASIDSLTKQKTEIEAKIQKMNQLKASMKPVDVPKTE